jgi:hypothetical protein
MKWLVDQATEPLPIATGPKDWTVGTVVPRKCWLKMTARGQNEPIANTHE